MPHFNACEKLGRLYRMRVRPAFFWPPTSSGGKGGWNLEKKATCEILKDRWTYFMTLICWVDWFWFAVCYFVVIVVVLSSWHAYGMVLVPCPVSRIPLPSRPPWWNACYTRYEVVDICWWHHLEGVKLQDANRVASGHDANRKDDECSVQDNCIGSRWDAEISCPSA